jgi:hypothetical protein
MTDGRMHGMPASPSVPQHDRLALMLGFGIHLLT